MKKPATKTASKNAVNNDQPVTFVGRLEDILLIAKIATRAKKKPQDKIENKLNNF